MAKPKRSAQVPGQYLGYSTQATRAAVRLLQAAPGSFVSVEVLDDVAVVRGHHAVVEQSKSVTSSANPISDRSPELWKTLANWIRAAQSNHIDPTKTLFELFVRKKRSGPIAASFSAAATIDEALGALNAAKHKLWGDSPSFPLRRKVAKSLAPHVEYCFNANPSIVAIVVQRMSLVFGTGSSKQDLSELLKTKLVSAEALEHVARQALGWVKERIDGHIEKGEPAVVAVDEFVADLMAFVRKLDRLAILNSFAPLRPKSRLDLELQQRTFIRQLDLIHVDYDVKLRAANDFLRASIDRSEWAAKGLVYGGSFDEFEDTLTRAWTAKRDIVAIQSKGQAPEDHGRLLYSECSLFQTPLESRSVPPHFTPGCFHALADKLTVGWHPEFKVALAQLPDDKEDPAA